MPVNAKTEDLEAFVTVVDTGGFSAAAALLAPVDAEHRIPQADGEQLVALCRGVKAVQLVQERDVERGPDALLERLHHDGHVRALLLR